MQGALELLRRGRESLALVLGGALPAALLPLPLRPLLRDLRLLAAACRRGLALLGREAELGGGVFAEVEGAEAQRAALLVLHSCAAQLREEYVP